MSRGLHPRMGSWMARITCILVAFVVCSFFMYHRWTVWKTDDAVNFHSTYLKSIRTEYVSLLQLSRADTIATTSRLFKKFKYPLDVYLKVLQNSVQLVHLPLNSKHFKAVRDCEVQKKPPMTENQHSLELRFPGILMEMSSIANAHKLRPNGTAPPIDFLWHNTTRTHSGAFYMLRHLPSAVSHRRVRVNDEPIFYYVMSFFYHVVYCTYKNRGKENWKAGVAYLEQVASYVITTPEWKTNLGVDFLSPASHPKSGPSRVHPASINLFQRQTFLRTDFDFTGSRPKDIIVPYFAPPIENGGSRHRDTSTNLLFFAGKENPPGGFRSIMHQQFQAYCDTNNCHDVVFTTQFVQRVDFIRYLSSSEFCLSLRGDTASSQRLFAILDAGCIPVIISDWIQLPFESLLDYSQFSIILPESITYDVAGLMKYLRSVTAEQRSVLRDGIRAVRPLLLFEGVGAEGSEDPISVWNPITLVLLEALQHRIEYCDRMPHSLHNHMCRKVSKRLAHALAQHHSNGSLDDTPATKSN